MFCWIVLVVTGHCWIPSIDFSTNQAHFDDTPAVEVWPAGLWSSAGWSGPQGAVRVAPGRHYGRPLRTPIISRTGRRLRICSVARFSTDEQRRESIRAQHQFNRRAVEAMGIADFEWEEVSDEGISGELRDRAGIARLREGIARHEWDLIICEDSSRLYRNMQASLELVGLAHDQKVRVICVGDDVDSVEEDWEERLQEAQQHHCRDNKYTRRRIKRAFQSLWDMGAAVGALRPGYRRRPTTPATEFRGAEGPFFDEIIPEWVPVIQEAFERIAGPELTVDSKNGQKRKPLGEPPWLVGRWLDEQRLPRTQGRPGPWNEKTVIALIRSEIYRGEEFYGKTKTIRKCVSGKSEQERNISSEVRQRKMPHLGMVSDALWYRANEAIDSRNKGGCKAKGDEHPLKGIPRDSRRPLSQVFYCGAEECDAKMHGEGRNEGGYRCSGSAAGTCWCKATALKDLAHEHISQAIVRELIPDREQLQVFVGYVAGLMQDEEFWKTEGDRLTAQCNKLAGKCARLGQILEDRDNPPQTLVDQLEQREREFRQATAELEDWRHRRNTRPVAPTVEVIVAALEVASRRVLDFDPAVGTLLQQLVVGKIRAVPYQLFQGNLVVLRAEFELNLVAILPEQLLGCLAGSKDWQPEQWLPKKLVRVDLFEPSLVARYALLAHELTPFLTLKKTGELLGMSERQAHLANQMGKAMRAAGITDPYIRLTEAPAAASRWRLNAKFRKESAT